MNSFFDNQNNESLLTKYLLVDISDTTYALKIEDVKEIIPIINMFTIDNLNNNITGLINLRGKTIPVYDIRTFLGKDIQEISIQQKLLLLKSDENDFAIIIDNVGDIVNISVDNISNIIFNQDINFFKTTVLNDNTVIVFSAQEFYRYASDTQNIVKKASASLVLTEKNVIEKLNSRMELLNQKGQFDLQHDVLFNEKFILFKLNEEIYAFNINYIKEIKKITSDVITCIPGVPDFLLGIINFRGDYISLLDIKYFLNIVKSDYSNKLDIVIIKINGLKLAIVVDNIIDITSLPIEQLNADKDSSNTYIIGDINYNNKMVNILNVEKLFSSENVSIENYD